MRPGEIMGEVTPQAAAATGLIAGTPAIAAGGDGQRAGANAFIIDPAVIKATLAAAGGPTTATELGLPRKVWRDDMKYARDVRNRWSFLDLADDAGLLDEFLNRDEQ